ncbi:uncharacterized protein LOC117818041 [Xyrichtys novacula]|uniref:Uncharacterized protein LOC117818041 n=1 Tax=Xyrichtys novacula TaxID=13765 RepID=A0AAV1FEH6_XYRNO|nr:uncharacterized protein LOC117818041 [Xyrichtys novacula]
MLWTTLLLLHEAYALVPMKTAQVGEPATLTCVFPDMSGQTIWYKQRTGGALELLVTLYTRVHFVDDPEFFTPFDVNINKNTSNLIILKTTEEDEGMYHCGVSERIFKTTWSATYLRVTGNTKKTSDLTVVQSQSVSDPVHPGDSLSLQCSVLSDSENQTCSGGHRVFWFRAGSDRSHPDLIYTDGNKQDECDQRSDPQKSCVYHFSKSISSSDNGTYYCAVATCGRILFGDGARVDIEQKTQLEFIAIGILAVCLVISVVGNVVLLHKQKHHKGLGSTISEAQFNSACGQTDAEDELNYAAPNFSTKKTRGRKKREFVEDGVYAQVEH